MKNTPSRHNRGFTLVALVIVVAILGVISAVIIPNVTRFLEVAREGQISQTASYTLYIVEDGAQKNIGMAVFGDVLIRYPRVMNIGDSGEVSLTFTPSSNVTTGFNFTGEPTPEGTYYMVSDKCQFYSVMQAELNAVNFEISSTSTQYKEVSLTSKTDWAWIISPNREGEQLLRVELSTPVRMEEYEESVSRAVYSQQIQILVRNPLTVRGFFDYWYNVAITIGATIGAAFGLRKLWKIRKRKRTQNAEI
jgi:type II secretory pathway pseudopilin PulG